MRFNRRAFLRLTPPAYPGTDRYLGRLRQNGRVLEQTPITSAANPKLKGLRALLRGGGRSQPAAFAAEGMQLLTRALQAGVSLDYVVVSGGPDALPTDVAALLQEARVPVYSVSPELFAKVSRRNKPLGVAFLGRLPLAQLSDLDPRVPVLALDRASNPRNIGAIARTCEAAGLGGLVLVGAHGDPFSYESVRASMGSVFGVPIAACSPEELVGWAESSGRDLIGTSGGATKTLWDLTIPETAVILFGNEGEGLTQYLLDACNQVLKIPFNPAVDSLNLAAAAAVVAFDYVRQSGETWAD